MGSDSEQGQAAPSPEETLPRIRAAAERIAPWVRTTPTVYSYTYSEQTGHDVWFKLENLQRTGSFKVRGALNVMLTMDPAVRARGVVAASAGNHAQGVALAARLVETTATIVMPERTALTKIRRTEGYGATVILHGESYDEAQARAHAIAEREGRALVHPYDDWAVIEGQGTVGLEILEQVADLDTVVVPIGGGGLVSGVALALKALRPDLRVVGVQAAGADPMVRSFRAGRRVTLPTPRTIAEGIRVGTPGRLTWPVVRALVDDCVTVDDEEISQAVVQALEKSKVMAEAAGAAGIAAVAAGRVPCEGRMCVVVCGGNIDLNLLGRLIEFGLASAGLYHRVQLRLADVPGALRGVLDVLEAAGVNILDVEHHRGGWMVPVGSVDVDVLVETRAPSQGAEVEALLRERGLEVRG